jgi:hypothetical protein
VAPGGSPFAHHYNHDQPHSSSGGGGEASTADSQPRSVTLDLGDGVHVRTAPLLPARAAAAEGAAYFVREGLCSKYAFYCGPGNSPTWRIGKYALAAAATDDIENGRDPSHLYAQAAKMFPRYGSAEDVQDGTIFVSVVTGGIGARIAGAIVARLATEGAVEGGGGAAATGVASKAGTGGADAVRLGQAGEAGVRSAYDIGPKVTRVINGRTRIFDGLTDDAVSEVKNVKSLSYTRQLRDYADYASANGLRLDVYVRGGTRLSGPLARADLDPSSPINIVRHLP